MGRDAESLWVLPDFSNELLLFSILFNPPTLEKYGNTMRSTLTPETTHATREAASVLDPSPQLHLRTNLVSRTAPLIPYI